MHPSTHKEGSFPAVLAMISLTLLSTFRDLSSHFNFRTLNLEYQTCSSLGLFTSLYSPSLQGPRLKTRPRAYVCTTTHPPRQSQPALQVYIECITPVRLLRCTPTFNAVAPLSMIHTNASGWVVRTPSYVSYYRVGNAD